MANNSEISITESEIMSGGIHSTPVPTKRVEENDVIKMMRLLFDEKFNEQSIKFDDKFHEQNTRFDNFNDKFNQFDEKFNDIKKEIKRQNCHIDKRISEIETHLDEIELEIKREIDKLNINKDKVSGGENYDKINKSMILENDYVDIDSDNEILQGVEYDNDGMLVCDELKRNWRESIIVKELQGVNFSLNGVVGGEVKTSHVFGKDESAFNIYLEDDRSANKVVPRFFSALHKWCSSCELVSPAGIERENVACCDRERYIERERYCKERERNRDF